MADKKVSIDFKPMMEAFAQFAAAMEKATVAFRSMDLYQQSLMKMLDSQIERGRRLRRVYQFSFVLSVLWAFFLFGVWTPGLPAWIIGLAALPSGWMVLDSFYRLTLWDNYTNEAEATREALRWHHD